MNFQKLLRLLQEEDQEKNVIKINKGIDRRFASIGLDERNGKTVYIVLNKKTSQKEEFDDVWAARERAFDISESAEDAEEQEFQDDEHSVLNMGETGRTFGQGYPNVPDDEDEYRDKVIHVHYISDVSDEDIEKFEKRIEKQVYEVFPWLSKIDLNDMRVVDILKDGWWMYRHFNEEQSRSLNQYWNFVKDESPESLDNPDVYPLYVTLYDRTRVLIGSSGWGGDDGFYGDNFDLIESIKVSSKHEIESVAEKLYQKSNDIEFDGIPDIVVEKQKGSTAHLEKEKNQRRLEP